MHIKFNENIKKWVTKELEYDITKFKEHILMEINKLKDIESKVDLYSKELVNEINTIMRNNLIGIDARLKVIESKFEIKKEENKE